MIAGLEFDAQGLVYLFGLLGTVAMISLIASSSPLMAKVFHKIKCKSLRFYDMEQELTSVHSELGSFSINGVPQFDLRHTILVGLLKAKLEAFDIPTPEDPRERIILLHEWIAFLNQLIVCCEDRNYLEAKHLHRGDQE